MQIVWGSFKEVKPVIQGGLRKSWEDKSHFLESHSSSSVATPVQIERTIHFICVREIFTGIWTEYSKIYSTFSEHMQDF